MIVMSELAEKLGGRFVVLDGGDGVGKGTQLDLLAAELERQGVGVCRVFDPGGTAIGDRIRQILLDNAHNEMAVECELLLYMASRAQLAAERIRPALAAGKCVLGDRYISSTVAYQGAGGAETRAVLAAGQIAVGATWPDLTIVLDLPVEAGLARAGNGAEPDRMESKAVEFHRRVRQLFLTQARDQPDRFAVVDAAGDVQDVHRRVLSTLTNWEFA